MTIKPIRTMINHSTTEVFFDNVRVPAENLIGEEGKGFRYILSGMNAERILIAAECIGDAKWLIEKASNYAKERVVFWSPNRAEPGHPVPNHQGLCAYARRRVDGASRRSVVREQLAHAVPNLRDVLVSVDALELQMAKMLAPRRYGNAAEACARATQALRKLLDGRRWRTLSRRVLAQARSRDGEEANHWGSFGDASMRLALSTLKYAIRCVSVSRTFLECSPPC